MAGGGISEEDLAEQQRLTGRRAYDAQPSRLWWVAGALVGAVLLLDSASSIGSTVRAIVPGRRKE